MVNDQRDRAIRYVKFPATFGEDDEALSMHVEMGCCEFPERGSYTFEVSFAAPGGGNVLKREYLRQLANLGGEKP